jgi:hypothetical protein
MTIIHNIYGGFKEKELREFTQYSPTIRTPRGGGHLPMVYQDVRGIGVGLQGTIRRLTPVECERLQGFPDNWTQFGELCLDKKLMKMRNTVISDTQRYKMMGNAVTTNVVTAIAENIPNDSDFNLYVIKCQIEHGDYGDDIVKMVRGYVEEGFMDYGQALMILSVILYPEEPKL